MNLMSGSLASKVRCTALHIPLLRNTQRASAGVRFQKKNHVLADRTLAEKLQEFRSGRNYRMKNRPSFSETAVFSDFQKRKTSDAIGCCRETGRLDAGAEGKIKPNF
jgi:hypothetical protein